MSSSNCCFLTWIQISQEAGKVVWYSHFFKNFPQFVVIHTVKGFSIVNKAEVDVFLEFSCFFYDPADVGNLISDSSAFFKTSLNIRKFTVHILLKPGLENFDITLLLCEMRATVRWFEHFLALPFFEIGMKTDLSFYSYKYSTLTFHTSFSEWLQPCLENHLQKKKLNPTRTDLYLTLKWQTAL